MSPELERVRQEFFASIGHSECGPDCPIKEKEATIERLVRDDERERGKQYLRKLAWPEKDIAAFTGWRGER